MALSSEMKHLMGAVKAVGRLTADGDARTLTEVKKTEGAVKALARVTTSGLNRIERKIDDSNRLIFHPIAFAIVSIIGVFLIGTVVFLVTYNYVSGSLNVVMVGNVVKEVSENQASKTMFLIIFPLGAAILYEAILTAVWMLVERIKRG